MRAAHRIHIALLQYVALLGRQRNVRQRGALRDRYRSRRSRIGRRTQSGHTAACRAGGGHGAHYVGGGTDAAQAAAAVAKRALILFLEFALRQCDQILQARNDSFSILYF